MWQKFDKYLTKKIKKMLQKFDKNVTKNWQKNYKIWPNLSNGKYVWQKIIVKRFLQKCNKNMTEIWQIFDKILTKRLQNVTENVTENTKLDQNWKTIANGKYSDKKNYKIGPKL